MTPYLFFWSQPDDPAPAMVSLRPDLDLQLWRPSLREPVPRDLRACRTAWFWTLLHMSRLFSNRAYAIVLIRYRSEVVHRSFLFPRYFRFPFMAPEDVQVGDTWTAPAWRGHALARAALLAARHVAVAEGRCVWYVTEAQNTPSQRVATSCGFRLYGSGVRTARWHLRALGAFVPTIVSPTG